MNIPKLHPIPDHPNYFATKDGQFYSTNSQWDKVTPKLLKPFKNQNGSTVLKVCVNGKRGIFRSVNRLMALTFIGPPPTISSKALLIDSQLNLTDKNIKWGSGKYATHRSWA